MSDLAFNNLLFQLCESDLDEKLRQLLFIFRDRLPGESRETVQSVPVLFDNLRELGVLDIDDLNPLREALRLVEKQDLVARVEEFEAQRREGLRDGTLQRHVVNRGVVSLQRAAGRLSGAISMKTAFKLAAGGVVFVAVYKILGRCSSIEEFCNVFNSCVLPAGTKLMELGEGSLKFMVKADDLAALKALWNRYQEGKLREDLQNFLVTEEIQHLGNGEELEVTVTIDEDEYNDACLDLMTTRGFHDPANIYARMDDKHKAILQGHCLMLEEDLEPMKVLSHLFQEGVLDREDKGKITAIQTRIEKTRKLIDILPTKPPNAFEVFVSALQKFQPHLAIPLVRAEISNRFTEMGVIKNELSGTRVLWKKEKREKETILQELVNIKADQLDEREKRQHLEKAAQDKDKTIRDLEEKYKRLCKEKENLESKCSALGWQLQETTEMEVLKRKLEAIKQEKKKLEKELLDERKATDQKDKAFLDLQGRHSKLLDKYKQLQHEYATAITRISEMQPQFSTHDATALSEMGATSRPKSAQIRERAREEKKKIEEESDEMNELLSSLEKGRSIPKARVFSYRSDFD